MLLILKQVIEGGLEATNICKEEVEKAVGVAKEASMKATIASEKCFALLEAAKALAAGEPPPVVPPLVVPMVPMVPQVNIQNFT